MSGLKSIEQLEDGRQQQIGRSLRAKWREQRSIEPVPDWIKEQAEKECIHIYNVGPWRLTRNMGSWGLATVPACPAEKQYVQMNPIADYSAVPAVFHEDLIQDEHAMFKRQIGGMFVAEQILGIGTHMHKQDSWIPMGVFIGSVRGPDAEPTKAELEAANKALTEQLWRYFNDANDCLPHLRQNMIDDEHHRYAARRLGRIDVLWMAADSPIKRIDCPNCGTKTNEGITQCPACKFILNTEVYDRWVLEGRISDPIRMAFLKAATEPDAPTRPPRK
jgi:hypothetical protein